ncbi:MAG: flagellar basal body rod protein FlgB [Armatimonadetes bacterium]|nr:flagellar basal body rod protein FlgB [Armatimonadota bacterium]
MFDKIFGGDTYIAQTRALDASTLRHQVISHNLANTNTPNYKRQEVLFESQLSRALSQRDSGGVMGASAVSKIQPQVVTVGGTSTRTDGNNVNLESESVALAENTLRYEVLSQSVGGFFSALKSVISGGR